MFSFPKLLPNSVVLYGLERSLCNESVCHEFESRMGFYFYLSKTKHFFGSNTSIIKLENSKTRKVL